MTKILMDSNIIIGIIKNRFLLAKVTSYEAIISEVTRLEILGYHKIKQQEEFLILKFIKNIDSILISKTIIDVAIELRKEKSMSIGDAIIAATAIQEEIPLLTANAKDFKHVKELDLFPMDEI